MSLPPNFLDQLRDRTSLAEVVGRVVKLTRKGREYSGLCPFHQEKTPSFTLNEEKAFYHCFGCGAHGDAIKFVMQTQNMQFMDAVRMLAEKAGLQMPEISPQQAQNNEIRKTIHSANQAAVLWYQQQLWKTAPGRDALNYLYKRGLSEKTIKDFQLGFAPDGREGLKNHLAEKGVAESLALQAGLLVKPEGGGASYDRFRGRIMFPIFDIRKQPIAFGGRVLGAGEPKYLNSPETEIFHKGRTLYLMPQAMPDAGKSREAVVVEGYMDAISLHQAGIANAVANLGTALTESHIEILWRYTDKILLCFDGDSAGQRAAARVIDRALPILRAGKEIRFVTIPQGYDPDSFVQANGAAAFRQLSSISQPLHEKLLAQEIMAKPLDTPESKADLLRRVKTRLKQIGDASIAAMYQSSIQPKLDELTAPPPRNFGRGGKRIFSKNPSWNSFAMKPAALPVGIERKNAELLLGTILLHPFLLSLYAEELGQIHLNDPDLHQLQQDMIRLAMAGEQEFDQGDLIARLDGHQQSLAQNMCRQLVQTVHWLSHDSHRDIEENWRRLWLGFRYEPEWQQMPAEGENVFTPEGWSRFAENINKASKAVQEVENALLGTSPAKPKS